MHGRDITTRETPPEPTTIEVTKPVHLCAVQIATRQLCRGIDFTESAVFDAVVGVSELANRLLVATQRSGEVMLRAIRVQHGYILAAQVIDAERGPLPPSARDTATFRSGRSHPPAYTA